MVWTIFLSILPQNTGVKGLTLKLIVGTKQYGHVWNQRKKLVEKRLVRGLDNIFEHFTSKYRCEITNFKMHGRNKTIYAYMESAQKTSIKDIILGFGQFF